MSKNSLNVCIELRLYENSLFSDLQTKFCLSHFTSFWSSLQPLDLILKAILRLPFLCEEHSFKRWLCEKKSLLMYDLQVAVLSMGTLQALKVPSMMSFYTFLCTFLCSWSIIVAPGVRLLVVVRCCYRQRYFWALYRYFLSPTLIYKKLYISERTTNYLLVVHLNAKYDVNVLKPSIWENFSKWECKNWFKHREH